MEIGRIPTVKKIISTLLILLIVSLIGFPVFAKSSSIPQCDVNKDGKINLSDLIKVSKRMNEKGEPGWISEDVDKNGVITVADMVPISNNYGESVEIKEKARIQKLSIAYNTINVTNQQFIAQHFDMLDYVKSAYTAAANIKTLNPNISIIAYYDSIFMQTYYSDWNYVNQFENWFVHDTSGNRVQFLQYDGPYLMNPNSGWSDYCAQKNLVFLQNHPTYDGFFADDTIFDLPAIGYEWTVPLSDFEDGIISNWSTWMLQHIQNLQTTIGNKIVMPNAWKYTQFCQNITGVHMWENFVHGRSHDVTQSGYGEEYTLFAINTLHAQAEKGNIISVLSGTKNADNNPTLARKWMLFTLICFLFAVEDMNKSYYAWNFFVDDASHGWYPEMDYRFGEPIADYYNIKGSVYARQFENATVVVNISPSTSYTVMINGTSYTIGNRDGLIIPK